MTHKGQKSTPCRTPQDGPEREIQWELFWNIHSADGSEPENPDPHLPELGQRQVPLQRTHGVTMDTRTDGAANSTLALPKHGRQPAVLPGAHSQSQHSLHAACYRRRAGFFPSSGKIW